MAVSKHTDSPRPILVYRPETFNVNGSPDTWVSTPFENNELRSIRDIHVIRSGVDGQDRLLFASHEGVSLVWFDRQTQKWCSSNIGSGTVLTSESEAGSFKFQGSDGVAAGSLGDDPARFIASTEVKRAETRKDLVVTSVNWRRFVIDQFEWNTGDWDPLVADHKPTLRVECGNFDGGGVDCILVSESLFVASSSQN
ncbi:unnamed protein product [Rhizoctonia solani]|uniref:Aldos-2-ulose dehydratase beta-propeller domain-containing protein n=1 Tax=Rhizoctonia solani TaxID=456999 RepID=A0A8H3BZI7_9AGAM|nr:unnamed protein product [Rhizoctonia solani]